MLGVISTEVVQIPPRSKSTTGGLFIALPILDFLDQAARKNFPRHRLRSNRFGILDSGLEMGLKLLEWWSMALIQECIPRWNP